MRRGWDGQRSIWSYAMGHPGAMQESEYHPQTTTHDTEITSDALKPAQRTNK